MGGLTFKRESNVRGGLLRDPELDSIIEELLSGEKQCSGSIRWESPTRADYVAWKAPVFFPPRPDLNLSLVLTAHKRKLPRKATFQLSLGGHRLVRLDVNPQRSHNNRELGFSVERTHWHIWPSTHAEPDEREMPHRQWLYEFLQRARISFKGKYTPPPHEPEQLKLI